jgi:hypothetical protein
MPLKIPFKAGSITNLTDARFFAAYEVDYIGFCFDPQSPNYISPQNALAIKGWIHGPKIVAEFANQDLDNVLNIINFFEPDVLELGDEYFDNNGSKIKSDLPVIFKSNQENAQLISLKNILFILRDVQNNFDMPFNQFSIMIDITDKEFDITKFIGDAIQIKGVAETEVGVRDYDELGELMEGLIKN